MAANYIRGVGQLATSRYDFQNHIDGYDFVHQASAIACSVTVDGSPYTTVQTALSAIASYIPYSLPSATNTTLGGIKLAGDLDASVLGSATSPAVTGLMGTSLSISSLTSGNLLVYNGNWTNANLSGDISGGYNTVSVDKLKGNAVSASAPSVGNTLVWTGSAWTPSTATVAMIGDVTGASYASVVEDLSGSGGTVSVKCANIQYASTISSPTIGQATLVSGDAEDLTIAAQQATSGAGGHLVMTGGNGTTGRGSVQLRFGQASMGVETAYVDNSRRVVALVADAGISSTQMPTNTGDMVLYVKDAATAPTTGSPVGGSILYSSGGQLNYKQSNGYVGSIGSIEVSGHVDEVKTYTYHDYQVSAVDTQELVRIFSLDTYTAVYCNYKLVGKDNDDDSCFIAEWTAAYCRGASTSSTILVAVEVRGASKGSWIDLASYPPIVLNGNSVEFYTGANDTGGLGSAVNWNLDITIMASTYT